MKTTNLASLHVARNARIVAPEAIEGLRKLADQLESGEVTAFGIVRMAPGGDVQVRYAGLEKASEALAMIGGLEHLKADIMAAQRS